MAEFTVELLREAIELLNKNDVDYRDQPLLIYTYEAKVLAAYLDEKGIPYHIIGEIPPL